MENPSRRGGRDERSFVQRQDGRKLYVFIPNRVGSFMAAGIDVTKTNIFAETKQDTRCATTRRENESLLLDEDNIT
jgi:hypothetical protein